MDKFVTRKDDKASRHVTAHRRHGEFRSWTHVSGGKLFCTPCNLVLDHTRKSSVEIHAKTAKHTKAVKGPEVGVKRQRTLDADADREIREESSASSTVSAQAKDDICKDWVSMCASANIPISKSDHPAVKNFLLTHVTNGGAIPSSSQLTRLYLPRETMKQKEKLRAILAGKPLSINFDETSDDVGRFVLNVLASPLEVDIEGNLSSYLLDTVFLKATNHSTVAQAVVSTLADYKIAFDNVAVFNTDNAAYMRKSYKDVLAGLFPGAVHVTCMAHVLNLLGESFRKPFENVDKFVKAFNAMFWHAPARKGRYLRYMRGARGEEKPKMVPNPIATRWNSWYEAVTYHRERLPVYSGFVEDELAHCKGQVPESLATVDELLRHHLPALTADMRFITSKSAVLVELTDMFQSQKPTAIKVWTALEDLEFMFPSEGCRCDGDEFTSTLNDVDKAGCQSRFTEAYQALHLKLKKYMTPEGQPGIKFLKELRIFNPRCVPFMSPDVSCYVNIPNFSDVSSAEFAVYTQKLALEAVTHATGDIDHQLFWKSVESRVPVLASLALKYSMATCTSADAERSFSLYNLLVSSRRRQLTEENIKSFLFLFYNKFCDAKFFE